MKGYLIAVITIFISIGHPVVAAPTSKSVGWSKEPSTVLGVKIGAALADQEIPPCPKISVRSPTSRTNEMVYDDNHKELCWKDSLGYWGLWGLENTPSLGFGYVANMRLDDGGLVVSGLTIRTPIENYGKLKALLIERYGRPTEIGRQRYSNGFGAITSGEILVWRGRDIRLQVEEVGNDQHSQAWFSSQTLAARKAQQDAQSAKAKAGNL